ncbi:unnamed protein product [Rhizophagus irregularis]|nr:unnamed protein product [Rhizophagus irregularis]
MVIDDFNKSNDSEGLSKDFNKLQINSKDEVVQNVYKMDVMQQQVNKHYTDDDDEILYNNPNLRSEQQDGIEIPDEI